ncbi:hypothetical protein PV08_06066 [Exophiala spinifera]|uniref:Uncharacterized protein n=1 Tax=Exophiala spinifera TaxID=91928 RepID=A0A0D2BBQ9_9EURO|nr:uncharacterized protein PV08_06066 [Exophiala spinifera]KIW16015.1 hypothetical protein PV08_06066 [Exophiala spinifera]
MACSPGALLGKPPGRKLKGISSESGGIKEPGGEQRRANRQLETHSLGMNGRMEALGAKAMGEGQISIARGQTVASPGPKWPSASCRESSPTARGVGNLEAREATAGGTGAGRNNSSLAKGREQKASMIN